jgi:hypothetical protein
MDYDTCHINLKVVDWTQTISTKTEVEPETRSIGAECVATDNPFSLSTGEDITKIPIGVYFMAGPLMMGNDQPVKRGIGVFDYSGGKGLRSVIACWIGLPAEDYAEVWAQVRSGAFTSSTIELDLAPLDFLNRHWRIVDQPGYKGRLFVLATSINFTYRTVNSKEGGSHRTA